MCLVRDRLSVAERLIGSESSFESVTKADSLCTEDGRTETLSFLGGSSGGFSGKGIALTFAVIPDEPVPRLPRRSPLSSSGSGRRAVLGRAAGWNGMHTRGRRAPAFRAAIRNATVSRGWV